MSNTEPPERSGAVAVPGLLLLLAYPFAVHFGALAGQPWPALLIFSLLLCLPPLLVRQYRVALFGLGILAVLGLLWWLTPLQTLQLFYLPPLAVLLLLWWWFARSLLPGQTPLVSRIAASMHGGRLNPALQAYTRGVTWLWLGMLSLLLLGQFWLSLYASVILWSLFAHFLNYLILAAVFVLEFFLRRWFLPVQDRIGLSRFVRMIGRLRLQDLR